MGTHVQSYDGQIKWIHFLIEDNDLLKNTPLFGIKPALM